MPNKKRYKIKRDVNGNVVQRTNYARNYIEETKYEYDLKGRILNESTYDSSSNTLTLDHYEYEEDEYGNVIKEICFSEEREEDELGNRKIIREDKNIKSYKNIYSNLGILLSTSLYDDEGGFCNTIVYSYKGGLLYKEEMCNKYNETYLTYYKYDENKDLLEKEFRTNSGEVSHYYTYKKIGEDDYSYTLGNPGKSKYKWKLSNINEDRAAIDIVEELTTPEVFKEIFEYIIKNYSMVKCLYLLVNETDAITYSDEIEKVKEYYKGKYNIECNYFW